MAGERVWPRRSTRRSARRTARPRTMRTSASGALFISRLPTNVATRSSSADDVAAVGTICRNLEGMAARLGARRGSHPHVVVARSDRPARRLDQRVDATRPWESAPPPHVAVRPSLGATTCCRRSARRRLPAMSVFAGGCDLAGVRRRVCRRRRRNARCSRRARAYVVRRGRRHRPTHARYRLLEPIRQYAGELLDASGEHDDRQTTSPRPLRRLRQGAPRW